MSEIDGTTEPVTTGEPTPTSFIGAGGELKEGWKEAYLDESDRGDAVFGRATNIKGVMKSLASAERMIGADKMVKPSDKFGDEDWDGYHRAGGWTNEPIPITAPEGLPDGLWSDERANTYSEGFNKLRLNPKQVAGIMSLYNADLASQITDHNNNAETSLAELKSGLLEEKGNAYTQFLHNCDVATEKGVSGESQEFRERIVAKYQSDPDLIRLLGNIGGQLSESGSIPIKNMAPTPTDIQVKINEIHNSDAFMKPTHPDHKAAMANLTRLHREKVNIKQPA